MEKLSSERYGNGNPVIRIRAECITGLKALSKKIKTLSTEDDEGISRKKKGGSCMIDNGIPLIDLHRHLDGNVRLSAIIDAGRLFNLPLPAWTEEELRPFVQVTEPQPGVMAFIEKFRWMKAAMANYEMIQRIAFENIEDAWNEGLDYIELRFSPWFMAETHELNMQGVVEAVIEGIKQGESRFGVKVNLIGILSRTYGVENAWKELDAVLSGKDHIVALDLAGDEKNQPGKFFVRHINKAREAGLKITIHSGEADGPHSVWQALNELGAARIGHGVHSVQDEKLMDYLAEEGIGIESCLTSNVQTCTVPDYCDHPLRFFLQHGIKATINTDDPGISNIDLPHEYRIAAPSAGLTAELIKKAQMNSLDAAFLSHEEKKSLLKKKKTDKSSPI